MDKKINRKRVPKKLYRLTVFEDALHKSIFTMKFHKLNLVMVLIFTVLLLIVGIFFLISYTPIRQFIPGYPTPEERQVAIDNIHKIDSLERKIDLWAFQLNNIHRVLRGKEPIHVDSLAFAQYNHGAGFKGQNQEGVNTIADSLFRKEVHDRQKFKISNDRDVNIEQIEGLLFFPPVKGVITEHYNRAISHPFVDIAIPENSVVSSILDGTVISAGWNDDTGYTIQVQHDHNLVSIYKHNIKLLKKTGDKVKAGTAISIVGDSGRLSTGSHLHFELWYNGEPIDPTKYINF